MFLYFYNLCIFLLFFPNYIFADYLGTAATSILIFVTASSLDWGDIFNICDLGSYWAIFVYVALLIVLLIAIYLGGGSSKK